jgi:D-alanine-D-alanine ligase
VAELRAQVASQIARYHQPILVEHYIEGREITIGLLGNLRPTAARRVNDRMAIHDLPDELTFLPSLEVDLDKYAETEDKLYTNRIKTEFAETFTYHSPAPIDPAFERELKVMAAAVFRVTGCKDVARVDFRLDRHNGDKPYILEVNPLPGLNPGYSDLCLQSRAAGWPYEKLIGMIVDLAAERQGLKQPENV